MHRRYLETHHPIQLNQLVLSGTLWTYLADLNEQAQARMDTLIAQMKTAEGVTESLKAADPMAWVLEDFWYGNIEPSEYDTSSVKEYKEALLRISRNEESLQDTLTDAQRKLFAQYLDSVRELQDMAECLLFQNSFRLGARMMLEIMHE